ncbi:MAG: M20/M25/M40 family metallo-hydrolase [Chloroflexota bacterium]|nr:M20/M25/M40 family metallo-hydrolase [Chloroflexota bacterium]
MADPTAFDKVARVVDADRQDLLDLCLLVGNLPDYAGHTIAVGEAVADWFKAAGIPAYLQRITDEAVNAIGVLKGAGGGKSLIMNAHMDAGEPPPPDAPESEVKMRGTWVDGPMLYGRGMINDKAQLCAEMIAVRAIKKAGVALNGDVTVMGVDFETGAPSVDEHQGINYPGEGFGTEWAINRGVLADYALVGETSEFTIIAADAGNVRLRIRVPGRRVYTPRLNRGEAWQDNPNPHEKAARVIIACEEWARAYQERETVEFWGGVIVPKAQVMQVRTSENYSYVYLDVRLAPGRKPLPVIAEVQAAVDALGVEGCEVVPYEYKRGYIAEGAGELIDAVKRAHADVLGGEPGVPAPPVLSMWRDNNVFNELGIPSVCYGPRRQRETMTNEGNRAMLVDDLVAAAKVYAFTAMNLCGVHEG